MECPDPSGTARSAEELNIAGKPHLLRVLTAEPITLGEVPRQPGFSDAIIAAIKLIPEYNKMVANTLVRHTLHQVYDPSNDQLPQGAVARDEPTMAFDLLHPSIDAADSDVLMGEVAKLVQGNIRAVNFDAISNEILNLAQKGSNNIEQVQLNKVLVVKNLDPPSGATSLSSSSQAKVLALPFGGTSACNLKAITPGLLAISKYSIRTNMGLKQMLDLLASCLQHDALFTDTQTFQKYVATRLSEAHGEWRTNNVDPVQLSLHSYDPKNGKTVGKISVTV